MPVNESKARSANQWEIWRKSGAVGTHPALQPLREGELDFRRRRAGVEFRRGNADVRSYPAVVDYLRIFFDDYDDRFAGYDDISKDWHKRRVMMLDAWGKPNYMEISQELKNEFDRKFFTNPKTGEFLSDKYEKVKPVITEITNIVSRGR